MPKRFASCTCLVLFVTANLFLCGYAEASNFEITDTESGKILTSGEDTIGVFMPFPSPTIQTTDSITEIEDGVFKWNRTFKLPHKQSPPAQTRLLMDFKANYKSSFSMIPSVSYNGNQWQGDGKVIARRGGVEPSGFVLEDGTPWSFAYHRTSVPGATYSENRNWTVSLFSKRESSDRGFSCSLIPESDATTHRLIWPEEEKPRVHCSKWKPHYKDGYAKPFTWPDNGEFTATAYLVVCRKTEGEVGYQRLLDFAWRVHYRPTSPRYSPEETWMLGTKYITESLWDENKKMFTVFLIFDGKEGYKPFGGRQIGWAGANGTASVSLIYDYLQNNNQQSLDMAISCLDAWKAKQLDNGLIDVASEVTWLHSQDICNQADGAEAFFDGYLMLKEAGIHRPDYLETALRICDFVIERQRADGLFGKAWDNNGVCVQSRGSIGSYMVRPLVMAYEMTGKKKYYEAARKGHEYYYKEFMQQGYATAGAIDIYAIDKTGAVGLLQGAMRIYEHTKDPDVLHKAKQAAYYLSTWQYHHTVRFPSNTPLSEIDYDTFGGTSVGTVHPAIDPAGLRYFTDLVRLAELTGETIWRQRAIAMWNNATIGISDGSLTVAGLPPYPAGAQSEAFFQTNWGSATSKRFRPGTPYKEAPMGYFNNLLVIWPSAFRLAVLRNKGNYELLDAQAQADVNR